MATGDTAPPLALSSSPPPLLDHSPSSLSSPLSDVEDKDADHEEMAMNIHNYSPGRRRTPERNGNQLGRGSDSGSDSDDESKLSEMDINDSEAETERLYDTPRKDSGTRDNLGTVGDVGSRQFVDRRDRPFERSPSKLQQQIQADLDAEHGASDNNSLSEGEEEDDDDDASIVSSEPELESAEQTHLQSPSPAKENLAVASSADCSLSQLTRQDSAESRKRKRPLLVEKPEPEQPRRKRTGSIVVPDFEFHGDDTVMIDEEGTSTNPQSGNHTGEEDNNEETTVKRTGDAAALLEQDTREPIRSEKAKRSNNRRRRSKSPQAISSQAAANALIETAMDVDGTVADQPTPRAEDGQNETADEEAEAAHRNEEELERKKAAWEELTAIEKQFSNFRERLYQERLDQLNQEEAMLTSDNPTHPEYLAMLQCISERRDERIRVSSNELQLRMAMLKRRAVAERAQIMSQFYQSVRESRERVLEELGQEWYDIQQERRRFANAVPDYGIRFPATKTQTIKQAVAYNKEVSVLSGFAKHIGFPAAPPIHGASEDQLESDLAAISETRGPTPRPVVNHPPPVFAQEYTAGYTAGLPFGRNLGPAGEQFIEHTPWANPNHPSHHVQRQHSQYPHHEASFQNTTFVGPSSGHRRHSHQNGGIFPPAAVMMNGDSTLQMQKSHSSAGRDAVKPSKLGPEQAMKRETVAQAL